MSELAFCKSFLSALDARPVKLSSDHIADARQYPAQGAVRSVLSYAHKTPTECIAIVHAAPPPTSAPPTAPNPKVHRRQRSLCLIDFDHYGDAQAHEAFDAHNPPLGYRPRQNIRLRSQAAVCDKGLIISSQDQDPVQEKARDGFKDVAGSNRR